MLSSWEMGANQRNIIELGYGLSRLGRLCLNTGRSRRVIWGLLSRQIDGVDHLAPAPEWRRSSLRLGFCYAVASPKPIAKATSCPTGRLSKSRSAELRSRFSS